MSKYVKYTFLIYNRNYSHKVTFNIKIKKLTLTENTLPQKKAATFLLEEQLKIL